MWYFNISLTCSVCKKKVEKLEEDHHFFCMTSINLHYLSIIKDSV